MRDITVDVDIDLDDVYEAMHDRDIEQMIMWLDDDGYLDKFKSQSVVLGFDGHKLSRLEEEFVIKLIKLAPKFHSISNEELELIENICKKYC
jgi:hypothetical protein